jgi:hypothetical protein
MRRFQVFFICNILPLVVNILELFEMNNQQLIQVAQKLPIYLF